MQPLCNHQATILHLPCIIGGDSVVVADHKGQDRLALGRMVIRSGIALRSRYPEGRYSAYDNCSPSPHFTQKKAITAKCSIIYYLCFPPGAVSCLVTADHEQDGTIICRTRRPSGGHGQGLGGTFT